MHARRVVTTFTESQYLAMEAASDERHELIDGQIVAMAGGSRRHSAVCHAVGVELTRATRGRGCVVFQSDLRLVLHASGSHVYSDLQVVCGVPSGPDDRSIDNPMVVVEVLSPSTADFDRGEKLVRYQRVPSVRDILLVDPDALRVEHWSRIDDDWAYTARAGEEIALAGCGATLRTAALFEGLEHLA